MRIEEKRFETRQSRMEYVAERFTEHLHGKVLDIGCDKKYLKELRPELEYIGVDMGPDADIRLNLDHIEALPFEDKRFDYVQAVDVLEHLERLHFFFGELVRVTSGTLVVSWPNAWCAARRPIERGKGSFAHYGLKWTPPEDRHRWFFNVSEAEAFCREAEKALPVRLVDIFVNDKPRPGIVQLYRRLRYGRVGYINRYTHTLWTVFRRDD